MTMKPIIVRVATRDDMEDVWELAYNSYVSEGYCPESPSGKLRHYELLDAIPETTVYLAERGDDLLGSVTFTIDSPAGLHTDKAFRAETNMERQTCAFGNLVLAASWRIVTNPNCRGKLDVLKSLIRRGLIHLEMLEVDILLCTFNPKHARAWKRLIGIELIAGPRDDATVNGAPAVLMRGNASEMTTYFRANDTR